MFFPISCGSNPDSTASEERDGDGEQQHICSDKIGTAHCRPYVAQGLRQIVRMPVIEVPEMTSTASMGSATETQNAPPRPVWSEFHFTVLVPTYRRAADLDRCLKALSKQDLVPTRVLIVRRADDAATSEVIERWQAILRVEEACVSLPGQVHALNAGLDWIRGQSSQERSEIDLVCILDDDTAPHARWLDRIATIFATEPDVGGVGGRDYNFVNGKPLMGEASPVGRILWFGRLIGNHHLGSGPRRDVDFLKGANMTYRMAAIGDLDFDRRLLGSGAQVHNDLAFSMGVRNRGWRLVYDPEVSVDHFSAERFDSDRRGAPAMDAIENMAVNFYLTLHCYIQPWHRRAMALFYNWIVGRRKVPGLLLGLWFRLRSNEDGVALREVCLRAWRTARKLSRSDRRSG